MPLDNLDNTLKFDDNEKGMVAERVVVPEGVEEGLFERL